MDLNIIANEIAKKMNRFSDLKFYNLIEKYHLNEEQISKLKELVKDICSINCNYEMGR